MEQTNEKLPTELMSAIPPAAALPASSIGGNCQNGAAQATAPERADDQRGECDRRMVRKHADRDQTRGAREARDRRVNRRSNVRSECRTKGMILSAILSSTRSVSLTPSTVVP